MRGNHRGRLDLIADILETSQGGVAKTFLMNRCNLSFKQLKFYLDFMLGKELLCIAAKDVNGNHGLLETTDKGKEFLKMYDCLKALLK
jgi:predicted transcriptional regulator